MISIRGLTKIYHTPGGDIVAIDNLTLHVAESRIFGVVGFSGAGKSSLVRCVNMLEHPTAGSIVVDGREITSLRGPELRAARRKIGMIFQHFNLLSSRTVFENVAFPLDIAGVPRRESTPKVNQLLDLVGLADKARAYPSQLSGGQKQRVGIARALANDPKVLLCDEATSALDPYTTLSILKLLKDINRSLNLTILLITHEMKVVTEICDHVAVIENGRIIEQGPVLEVFLHPRARTTRNFVATVLNTGLPEEIRRRLQERAGRGEDGTQIVRLSFVGESAGEPVISRVIRECNVDVNILSGNIDRIQDTPFGILLVEILGAAERRAAALDFLAGSGLTVEVIDHV
ncbi:MAG: methionine ABC transporter ATP-binding protein [Thermoanaerobacterales bacterium]|nr:methionine ABC transporter ATP-binding protein [Thermoanaerobacterales bacterium]